MKKKTDKYWHDEQILPLLEAYKKATTQKEINMVYASLAEPFRRMAEYHALATLGKRANSETVGELIQAITSHMIKVIPKYDPEKAKNSFNFFFLAARRHSWGAENVKFTYTKKEISDEFILKKLDLIPVEEMEPQKQYTFAPTYKINTCGKLRTRIEKTVNFLNTFDFDLLPEINSKFVTRKVAEVCNCSLATARRIFKYIKIKEKK